MNTIKIKSKKLCALFIIIISLCGCGSVKSSESLIDWATDKYGECSVISQTETEDKTVVTLHDDAQDFDYEVKSQMSDVMIDGAKFGSTPDNNDTFEDNLKKKVISNVEKELIDICDKYNVRYETCYDKILVNIFANTLEDGKNACLEFAEIFQKQNINNRLDGYCINVYGDNNVKYYENSGHSISDEDFGSVKLPDIKWRTHQDELVEYYTEMARMQTDKNAEFVRSEVKKFKDTGADLNKVVIVLGTDYPTTEDSEVIFYYFKSSDGEEYYLCDFNYYSDDYANFTWFTNYNKKY